jgi:hypothetical protein
MILERASALSFPQMILVNLTTATICFLGSCYPALVGKDTPVGQFDVIPRKVLSPGYGGDVLQFAENDKAWFGIHRVWLLRPEEHREKRLKSSNPKERVISKGCINVEPAVYEALKDCCSHDRLTIER